MSSGVEPSSGYWEDLYVASRGELYRAAAFLLGPEEGEEVVQEAFEQAMRQRDFAERVREPSAWLRRVVVRRAISRLRRRALWDRVRAALHGDAAAPDPDLAEAIRALPPSQRGAIVLRYYFGAGYAEIAQTLNLRESSVSATLSRARAALRRALE